jgi:hypothetical protein
VPGGAGAGPFDGSGSGGGSASGGGTSGGGTSGGTIAARYSQFVEAFATTYCRKMAECGQAASGQTECVELLRSFFTSREVRSTGFAPVRSVATGASRFDELKAGACLDVLKESTCRTFSRVSCITGIVVPAAGRNEACIDSFDCVDRSLSCNGAPCNRRCTPGGNLGEGCVPYQSCQAPFECIADTCRNVPALGSPCGPRENCGKNANCDNGVCVAAPSIGALCSNRDPPCVESAYCDGTTCRARKSQGSSCSLDRECSNGFICIGGRCSPIRQAGQACVQTYECDFGLSCSGGFCRPLASAGERCLGERDCRAPLVCDDVTKVCATANFVGDGQPCTNSTQVCLRNVCRNRVVLRDGGVGTTGICGPAQPGDRCQESNDCGPGAFCEPISLTCRAAGPATRCREDFNCRESDYCTRTNICAARAATGQLCDAMASNSCAAAGEFCRPTPAGEHRCQPLAGLGSPCRNGELCLFPLSCRSGTCVAVGLPNQPCFNYFTPIGVCPNGACRTLDGGSGGEALCRPPLSNGALCLDDSDCQSGFCDAAPGVFGVCTAACN